MRKEHKYRALLLDIDGTLVHPGCRQPDEETVAALEELRRHGVTVVLATGRTLMAARPEVMGSFRPDYYICINGAYVAAGDGEVLCHHPMSQRQFDEILRLAQQESCPMGFAFPEGYYTYVEDRVYRDYYREVNGDMAVLHNGSDHIRHLKGMPYAAFGMIAPHKRSAFIDSDLGLHLTLFDEDVYDISQQGHTKASGAARLLAATGIAWEELVAVGDGENDIELLSAAGLGIAMGNAPSHVKAHADGVTLGVEHGGVLHVIREYF